MDDIVLNKAQIIERALKRVNEMHEKVRDELETSLDAQDVIVLNLQRACEAAIDLAMHLVRIRQLGLPKESRDAFTLLKQAKIVDTGLADNLIKMVAFRNIAVHDYRELDWQIIRNIVEIESKNLLIFSQLAVQQFAVND